MVSRNRHWTQKSAIFLLCLACRAMADSVTHSLGYSLFYILQVLEWLPEDSFSITWMLRWSHAKVVFPLKEGAPNLKWTHLWFLAVRVFCLFAQDTVSPTCGSSCQKVAKSLSMIIRKYQIIPAKAKMEETKKKGLVNVLTSHLT